MRKKRTSISVAFDPDVVAAGRAAVAEGRAWSFSAWVNHAARRLMAEEQATAPPGQDPSTLVTSAGGRAP
jgi:hypothetical protein